MNPISNLFSTISFGILEVRPYPHFQQNKSAAQFPLSLSSIYSDHFPLFLLFSLEILSIIPVAKFVGIRTIDEDTGDERPDIM
jgi:hypothetical protein